MQDTVYLQLHTCIDIYNYSQFMNYAGSSSLRPEPHRPITCRRSPHCAIQLSIRQIQWRLFYFAYWGHRSSKMSLPICNLPITAFMLFILYGDIVASIHFWLYVDTYSRRSGRKFDGHASMEWHQNWWRYSIILIGGIYCKTCAVYSQWMLVRCVHK